MNESNPSPTENWLKKAEEALQMATDALGQAWKSTEGPRSQAWETAKSAVNQAAEAVDQGLAAAKDTWQQQQSSGTDDDYPTGPTDVAVEAAADADPNAGTAEGEQVESGDEADDAGSG